MGGSGQLDRPTAAKARARWALQGAGMESALKAEGTGTRAFILSRSLVYQPPPLQTLGGKVPWPLRSPQRHPWSHSIPVFQGMWPGSRGIHFTLNTLFLPRTKLSQITLQFVAKNVFGWTLMTWRKSCICDSTSIAKQRQARSQQVTNQNTRHELSPSELCGRGTPYVPLPTRQHPTEDQRGCEREPSAVPHRQYQGHAVCVVCSLSLSGQKQHGFILRPCSSCFQSQIEFTMRFKQQ